MIKPYFIYFLFLFILPSHKYGASVIYGTNNGTISFHSDAPLELITANSKELRGKLDIEKKVFAFTVKISSFTGFNNPLQKEHFNENYLESTLFPNASFSGKIIEDFDFNHDGEFTIRAKGNLLIHGVTQERIIKGNLIIKNGILSINANFTVLLDDHNIAIPKVVHEKLASEIKVSVKADLTAQ